LYFTRTYTIHTPVPSITPHIHYPSVTAHPHHYYDCASQAAKKAKDAKFRAAEKKKRDRGQGSPSHLPAFAPAQYFHVAPDNMKSQSAHCHYRTSCYFNKHPHRNHTTFTFTATQRHEVKTTLKKRNGFFGNQECNAPVLGILLSAIQAIVFKMQGTAFIPVSGAPPPDTYMHPAYAARHVYMCPLAAQNTGPVLLL
jgi:hypothetical protein